MKVAETVISVKMKELAWRRKPNLSPAISRSYVSGPATAEIALFTSLLHHFVALAQKRGYVEIILLEVGHHRAAQVIAHAVERNHFPGHAIGSVRQGHGDHVIRVAAIYRHAVGDAITRGHDVLGHVMLGHIPAR